MPAFTMRIYTMAKKVVIPAMISMRIVEPDAVMPKNLSSPAAFLVLVTNNSSLILIRVQNGSQGAAGAEKVMREGSVSDGNTPCGGSAGGNHRNIVSHFSRKGHAFSGISVDHHKNPSFPVGAM